jgi:hypothetical protein
VYARVADEDKRREAYVAVKRDLEKLEEVYKPSLQVIEPSIEFDPVRYA